MISKFLREREIPCYISDIYDFYRYDCREIKLDALGLFAILPTDALELIVGFLTTYDLVIFAGRTSKSLRTKCSNIRWLNFLLRDGFLVPDSLDEIDDIINNSSNSNSSNTNKSSPDVITNKFACPMTIKNAFAVSAASCSYLEPMEGEKVEDFNNRVLADYMKKHDEEHPGWRNYYFMKFYFWAMRQEVHIYTLDKLLKPYDSPFAKDGIGKEQIEIAFRKKEDGKTRVVADTINYLGRKTWLRRQEGRADPNSVGRENGKIPEETDSTTFTFFPGIPPLNGGYVWYLFDFAYVTMFSCRMFRINTAYALFTKYEAIEAMMNVRYGNYGMYYRVTTGSRDKYNGHEIRKLLSEELDKYGEMNWMKWGNNDIYDDLKLKVKIDGTDLRVLCPVSADETDMPRENHGEGLGENVSVDVGVDVGLDDDALAASIANMVKQALAEPGEDTLIEAEVEKEKLLDNLSQGDKLLYVLPGKRMLLKRLYITPHHQALQRLAVLKRSAEESMATKLGNAVRGTTNPASKAKPAVKTYTRRKK